jgi:hypothetical protein
MYRRERIRTADTENRHDVRMIEIGNHACVGQVIQITDESIVIANAKHELGISTAASAAATASHFTSSLSF